MKKQTNLKKHVSAYVLGAMLLASMSPVSAAIDSKAPSLQPSTSPVSQTQLPNHPTSSTAQDKVSVISKQAGFELHFPDYIQTDYTSIDLSFSEKTNHVVSSFFSQTKMPFYLEMWKGDISKESKGLTKITTNKGTAFQGTQKTVNGDANVLIWEEEKGIIYRLIGKLSQAELVKIAESVKKGNKIERTAESGEEQVINGVDTTKASELFGSPIKLPAYLPSGVKQESVAISGSINKNDCTITIYDQATGTTGSYFSLEHEKGSLTKENTADMKPTQLVQGTAFIGTVPLVSFMHPELKQLPILVWEKDGVVYKLRANVSIEELQKIAESLYK